MKKLGQRGVAVIKPNTFDPSCTYYKSTKPFLNIGNGSVGKHTWALNARWSKRRQWAEYHGSDPHGQAALPLLEPVTSLKRECFKANSADRVITHGPEGTIGKIGTEVGWVAFSA